MRAPWNASWTAEQPYEVRPCRYAGNRLALWQPFKPGEGKPLFAVPHAVRQRKSIAERRCTVCGERTEAGARVFFPRGSWIIERGVMFWATTEAPVHPFCAELALKVCPRLREDGREAIPFPENATILLSLIGGPAVEADFGLKIPIERPVVGSLKIAFSAPVAAMFAAPPSDATEVDLPLSGAVL